MENTLFPDGEDGVATSTSTTSTNDPTLFDDATRPACLQKPNNAGGCSPELVATGDAGGVELNACCGEFTIHTKSCNVNPCELQADIVKLKRKVGVP